MKQLNTSLLRIAFRGLKPTERVVKWGYENNSFYYIIRKEPNKGKVIFTLNDGTKKSHYIEVNYHMSDCSLSVSDCQLDHLSPDLIELLLSRLVIEAVQQATPQIRWKGERERDAIGLMESWGAAWHGELELDIFRSRFAPLLDRWGSLSLDPAERSSQLIDIGMFGGVSYLARIIEEKKVSSFKLLTMKEGVIEIDLHCAFTDRLDIGTGVGYNIESPVLFDCLLGHILINSYERKTKMVQGNFGKDISGDFVSVLKQFSFDIKQGARTNVSLSL